MNFNTLVSVVLPIVAATLSVASFGRALWEIWRDRPRLVFYVRKVRFIGIPGVGEMPMVQVTMSNIGYRPIILVRFVAIGERSILSMGTDDEPAAMLGQEDQKFPVLLEPGKSHKIHPISVDALIRNAEKPVDEKVFHDPYLCFSLIDSFGRLYPLDIKEVRGQIGIQTMWKVPRWWEKPSAWYARYTFFRKAKRLLRES